METASKQLESTTAAQPLCGSCGNPFTQQGDVISNFCPLCAGKAMLGVDPRPTDAPVESKEEPASIAPTNSAPTNGKKPHHAFGDPTKPLWKDIVGDMSKNGPLTIAQWEASVLWLVKPFAVRNNWSGRELVKKAVRSVRRMKDRYPKVGEILAIWDAMPAKARSKVMSLDKAVEQVEGISKDEFAGLILAGMKNEAYATAKAIQAAAIPDMMAASLDSIQTNQATASSERVRHMETMGLVDKQSKGGVAVNVNASASASGDKVATKSFDSQLTELDNALDADYEMLPPGGQKQIGSGQ